MSAIKTLICWGVITVSMASCRTPETNDGIISFKLNSISEVSSPYPVSHWAPLETTPENLLGEYLVAKTRGNDIYIYDENARDAIHHFAMDGKYLGKAVEVGEGPETVDNIADFVPTASGLEVLVSTGGFSKLVLFDHNYTIRKEIALGYLAHSFEKLADGKYVLSGSYNLPFVQHRLVYVDAEGERLQEFLPNDYSNDMMPMSERNFHKEKDQVFFHEVFNPVAYEVMADSLEARFKFDFGKYAIPGKFWEVDIMQGFEMINENGFASIYSYWETDSKAFFEIYLQRGGTKNHQVIWDKESKKAIKRVFSKEQNPAFYYPIGLIGDQLVFIAQAADVLALEMAAPRQGIDRDDNPVLLFVDF